MSTKRNAQTYHFFWMCMCVYECLFAFVCVWIKISYEGCEKVDRNLYNNWPRGGKDMDQEI